MLAVKQDALTRSFLKFASEASNLLHIKTEQHYNDALETIEHLFVSPRCLNIRSKISYFSSGLISWIPSKDLKS